MMAELFPAPPVYVDPLFHAVSRDPQARRLGARYGHQWCHLWSADLELLHAFAGRLGLRRAWFQDRERFPHYDLVPPRRVRALQFGAVEISLLEWVRGREPWIALPRPPAGLVSTIEI